MHLLGYGIEGMVAMSFAYHYPEAVGKLIVADGAHPTEGMPQMPMIPAPGTFGEKTSGKTPSAWWMAFN